jgi:hypothetical protein
VSPDTLPERLRRIGFDDVFVDDNQRRLRWYATKAG